jgi:hypothetical protein
MGLSELRTYTLYVGKMAEAVKLYQEIGFPALQKGGQDKKLVGYSTATPVQSINSHIINELVKVLAITAVIRRVRSCMLEKMRS